MHASPLGLGRALKAPVPNHILHATLPAQITPLIADNIYKTAELPGSNGSALRGNITIAGLLWAVSGAAEGGRGRWAAGWPAGSARSHGAACSTPASAHRLRCPPLPSPWLPGQMIGNFLVLLATLWSNLSGHARPGAGAFPANGNGSAASNKNLDAAAGV